jgi:hypothetical protein
MTRAVWISFALSTLALAFRLLKHPWRAVGAVLLAAALLAGLALGFNNGVKNSLWDRLEERGPVEARRAVYSAGWAMFQDHPLTGWPAGKMYAELGRRMEGYQLRAYYVHNTYLALLIEFGLPGLALYGILFFNLFRLSRRKPPEEAAPVATLRKFWPILLCVYLFNAFFVDMAYQFVIGLLFTVAGILRLPNTGSVVELSSKFGCEPGEAVDLAEAAGDFGLVVEGVSFHVGSQCLNFENYVQALNIADAVMREAKSRGREIKILDIGGGFPAPYNRHVKPFAVLGKMVRAEIKRLFSPGIEILAEPGRFLVATAATLVARIIGKAVREGKTCYFIDDSIYSTFSGIPYDHCQYDVKAFKKGKTEIGAVYGHTCDGLDVVSQSQELPDLQIEDLVYTENIGAYSTCSATWFNGFPPARVVHVNE